MGGQLAFRPYRVRPLRARRALRAFVLCGGLSLFMHSAVGRAAPYGGFSDPQAVTIPGFLGSAMEPFISPDGKYLLFNSSNVGPSIPRLQIAARGGDQNFIYQGELEGEAVNEPGILSGTPSLDLEGRLYFISNRSYSETLSTLYEGQFSEGRVSGVHLVPGVSGETPGFVDFDASASPDGSRLYVSVGDFRSGSGPTSASIRVYDSNGEGLVADPGSSTLLHTVNSAGALDYAPAISYDGLELFFTAASPAVGRSPAIYRAVRSSMTKPFGAAQRVAAITGFAEAPSLSSDGTTLYYHELVGSEYEIKRVTRSPAPAPAVTGISPKRGPASGGVVVRIKGSNLAGVSAVSFGAVDATTVQVRSASEITATSPPGLSGTNDVLVTTPSGDSAPSNADRYQSIPIITSLLPNRGPVSGGTNITVSGSGFGIGAAATTIKFASQATFASCPTTTTCSLVAPPHRAGSVDVTATVERVTSARSPAATFAYE